MSKIIELAHALGDEIAKSEEMKNLEAAKAAYDNDEEVQKLVMEFNMHRMTLQNLDDQNPERTAEIEERIKAVYGKIMENEKMQNMQATGKAVEELLSQVNGVISFYVTGEEPSACTHDCSTCGGCH
ncbi:MAG: YlbF family regulator [Clostridia bacterium]|nr:YlbF family regulator [Clostridia bacterium]